VQWRRYLHYAATVTAYNAVFTVIYDHITIETWCSSEHYATTILQTYQATTNINWEYIQIL